MKRFISLFLVASSVFLMCSCGKTVKKMADISSFSEEELNNYVSENGLELTVNEVYSDEHPVGSYFNQSIKVDDDLSSNKKLSVDKVIGTKEDEIKHYKDIYSQNNVNELGRVPIMMYHGIHNKKNDETKYTGGNVDKDGYQRTAEAFRADLDFYYNSGYRMVRLNDYVNGIIDVELGKSPLIITFDDGLQNNINVTGLDDKGEIIIDPNSAVGILEEYKKKYPDFNVTATFFVNAGIFNQEEYNEKILHWMVDHGYDIGNHTANHPDFTTIDFEKSKREVGYIYDMLDQYIPGKYVNIVALPFGSPYKTSHANYSAIVNSSYNGKDYTTISCLRVGWESDYSPFSSDFDKSFLKRIRAYDNNGEEFDIEMNFKILANNRYISDGDKNRITFRESDSSKFVNNYNLDVFKY